MIKIKLLIILIICPVFLYSQNATLITDRPDHTESSETVPKGSLQIETGLVLENDNESALKTTSLELGTTLLRYGILNNVELRLETAYQTLTNEIKGQKTTTKGINGLGVGFKWHLFDAGPWAPSTAVIGIADLPVGQKALRPPETEYGFIFAMAHSTFPIVDLSYNLGNMWLSDETTEFIYSLALGFEISRVWGCYIEIYGTKPENSDALVLYDMGVTYLVKPNFQLDLSFGLAGSPEAMDWFISGGFTLRLPE